MALLKSKRPRALAFILCAPSLRPSVSSGKSSLLRAPTIHPVCPPSVRPPIYPMSVCMALSPSPHDDDVSRDEHDPSVNNLNSTNDNSNHMNVYNKSGRQRHSSDLLPFHVSVVSPPPKYLGRFRLDPRTHCGDIVEHDGAHFEVKVVRLRYKYIRGQYQVVGKVIEVKSLARNAIEAYLERTLRES